jgi:TonB family protein
MLKGYSLAVPLILSLLIHAVVIGVGERVSRFFGNDDRQPSRSVEYSRDSGAGKPSQPPAEDQDEESAVPGHPGDSISLETPDPAYRPYFNSIRRRIGENWEEPRRRPGGPQSGSLTVEFSLGRAGDLKSVEVAESSGVKGFDFAAVSAVKKAAPFDAFPPSISSPELLIRALFVYD